MKWDRTRKNDAGTTIREAYFQDEKEAFTLFDIGGKFLKLEDLSEFVYATAVRQKGRWEVQIRDGKTPRQFVARKDDAIDLILGKA